MLPIPPSCHPLKLCPLKLIAQGPVLPGESNGRSPFAARRGGQGSAWAFQVADKTVLTTQEFKIPLCRRATLQPRKQRVHQALAN